MFFRRLFEKINTAKLAMIIQKATEPDPASRFEYAGDLASALEEFLSGGQRSTTTRAISKRVTAQTRAMEESIAATEQEWVEDFGTGEHAAAEPPPLPQALQPRAPSRLAKWFARFLRR